jgi:hypothetical protein
MSKFNPERMLIDWLARYYPDKLKEYCAWLGDDE